MGRFFIGRKGQSLVEYALIISGIAVVLVASLVLFRDQLTVFYQAIVTAVLAL